MLYGLQIMLGQWEYKFCGRSQPIGPPYEMKSISITSWVTKNLRYNKRPWKKPNTIGLKEKVTKR